MSRADIQYLGIIKNILDAGSLGDNRTGMPAYKLPHQIMQFDLEKEFPILTTKFVAFKTSVKEILWIWQKQSNDVRLLQQWNCHVWDEWMREDGTIGKAYGYQLGKYHQVDTLLETLKKDPQSRRMVVDLWNVKDLPDMALYPCAFLTMWDVSDDGRLNCMLVQLAGFACFVIHPVPNDMCVKIGLPSGNVFGIAVMSLVTVDEHLQGCDTPAFLAHLAKML